MGDRVYTEIRLSGKLPLSKRVEFEQLLENQGLQEQDDDPSTFIDFECNYANLDDFKDWCVKHDISYYHWWHAGGGFGSGMVLNELTDGGNYLDRRSCEGDMLLTQYDLAEAIKQGQTLQDLMDEVYYVNNWRNNAPPLEFV